MLCSGILTGAYLFDVDAATRNSWLLATVASGMPILLLDLHESGVFLLQVRGLIVVGKIGVLAALPLLERHQTWALAALVVISALISHAPGRVRYYVAFGSGRLKGSKTKG